MNKQEPFNMWTKLHLLMAVVFAGFGIYFLHDGGARIAYAMYIMGAHALFAAFLYFRHPQYASNGSNMSVFLTNFQRLLMIICVYCMIFEVTGSRPSTYILVLLCLGAAAALYFTVRAFLAFSRDLSSGGR